MKIKEKVHINQRPVKGGGFSLHLDYRIGGKRIREFLKLYLVPAKTHADKIKNQETIRLATEIKNKRIRELDSGELNVSTPKKIKTVLAADYFEKKISSIKTENSRQNNQTMVNALKDFKRNATLAEINRDFFKAFVDYLLEKRSVNTARLYAVLLKARLHDAYIDGMIPQNPDLYGLTPKKLTKDVEFLDIDELRKLQEADAPEEVRNPFLFCCFTGLRFSDVKRLKWENIEKGIIILRMEKTDEIVRVPLSENARKFMPQEKKHKGFVFEIDPLNSLNRKLKNWAAEAGIKKNLHFHMSRHTFATLALKHGAELYTVSKLLGHKSVETTQIYAKVLDEGRRKAVDAIPEL
ncbi:MAG: site-specific integrase [Fibrobacter sp.]|uniref:site-specific integrase n=1 Tax=Fibrobacter sp. TaxID=35828 RepID=UPI001B1AA9D5|nr:site-specific integrase [Fibrobacter sp.]MBO7060139.1 site-specific integrase [Fibrobacter sp.]